MLVVFGCISMKRWGNALLVVSDLWQVLVLVLRKCLGRV